jgi:hypothetical protein
MALAVFSRRAAFLAPVLRLGSANTPSAASLASNHAARAVSTSFSARGIDEFFGRDLLAGDIKPSGAPRLNSYSAAYESLLPPQGEHGRHRNCELKASKICMLFGLFV